MQNRISGETIMHTNDAVQSKKKDENGNPLAKIVNV